MKQLDLHHVKHDEAERLVENFVLLNEPPMEIVTGNSTKMKSITKLVLIKHGLKYWDNPNDFNMGVIIILN
jgi:hypothetical protein